MNYVADSSRTVVLHLLAHLEGSVHLILCHDIEAATLFSAVSFRMVCL